MPQGMHGGMAVLAESPRGNNNCLRTKNAKIIITSTKERRALFLIHSGFQFQALYGATVKSSRALHLTLLREAYSINDVIKLPWVNRNGVPWF
jgi:hypothetical protein